MTADEVMALIRASDKPHYVYLLCRSAAEPFYVGVGSGRRVLAHREKRELKARTRKANTIKSMIARGEPILYRIEGFFATRAEAIKLECSLIAELGRLDHGTGPLTNGTSGGDGVFAHSPAALEKMAASSRSMMADPAKRRHLSTSATRDRLNPEYRERHRQGMAKALSDPEARERFLVANKVASSTPEKRMKLSRIGKDLWSDPRHRDKVLAAQASAEAKAKYKSSRKYGPLSEDQKAKIRAARARQTITPEHREKISAGLKAAYANGKR